MAWRRKFHDKTLTSSTGKLGFFFCIGFSILWCFDSEFCQTAASWVSFVCPEPSRVSELLDVWCSWTQLTFPLSVWKDVFPADTFCRHLPLRGAIQAGKWWNLIRAILRLLKWVRVGEEKSPFSTLPLVSSHKGYRERQGRTCPICVCVLHFTRRICL